LLVSGCAGLFSGRAVGTSAYLLIQGLVFGAFGFNMVDAGGLLGGRLDVALVRPREKRRARETRRAKTIPLIKLSSQEEVPLTRAALESKSMPAAVRFVPEDVAEPNASPRSSKLFPRLDIGDAVGIVDAVPAALRSPSPTAGSLSGGDSESNDSVPSTSSSSTGKPLAVIKIDERWPSPTSSLVNIYAPRTSALPAKQAAASVQRRGWRFVPFGGGGYTSEHDD
jgi:hypothetical protein